MSIKSIHPIELLRTACDSEEIDHNFVISTLQKNGYISPRDVITRLIKSNRLIRIKKGLYIFGDRYRRRPVYLEVLANQIYGPSYVSREFALQYYGMIPEAVFEVTSMSMKRDRSFKTPMGYFSYRYLPHQLYSIGITQETAPDVHFLIATPEKALVDLLYYHKVECQNSEELKEIILEGYRIDPEEVGKLKIETMREIGDRFSNKTTKMLIEIIREVRRDARSS